MKVHTIVATALPVTILFCTPTLHALDQTANHDSTNGVAARGNDATTTESKSLLDVELDPLAFVANGFSVHAGWRIGHWRIDVGAFGAELPSFLLSNDVFRSRFSGFGLKLDYHLRDCVGGAFFGIAVARVTNTITHKASSLSEAQILHEISGRVGYEFDLAWGLYVVPWLSVGAILGSENVTVGEDTLNAQGPLGFFPSLHLGYRL